MKRITALALPFAALFATASLADDKPLFVYVCNRGKLPGGKRVLTKA